MIIERHRHAHIMKRRRIALKILDGVGIGMKHIGVGDDFLRDGGLSLNEVVVVGIHTSDHVASDLLRQQFHHHSLLSPVQPLHARGEHDFKIAVFVLIATEHGTPEEDIIVALHIGYDSSS